MVSWTTGRRKAFIISTLRGGFRRYPPKYEVLRKACVGVMLNAKTGRMAKHYTCATCIVPFPAKEVQVDHIEPIVDPLVGFINFDVFAEKLFCEEDNLQVLCKPCHLKKTKVETDMKPRKEKTKRKKK